MSNIATQKDLTSATEPDWTREQKRFFEWNPSRSLLKSVRCHQKWKESNSILASVCKKLTILQYRFWSIVTGAEIPINANIGGGLLIPHPNGIVIHPDAIIGPNCLIFQQVTIGAGPGETLPVIGGHVDIGAGAKVLGALIIGDHAKIGANAVVLMSVPVGKTAVGVPARIVN